MSTPIARNLETDGSRVPMRRPDSSAIVDAQGRQRWTDHPAGVPRDQWNVQAYEAAVVVTCTRIMANRTGRIVIDELARPVTILPFALQAGGNAFNHASHFRGGTVRGEQPRFCSDIPSTPIDETGRPIPNMPRGTGVGSATFVEFTPAHWPGVTAPGPGAWVDEVLTHELVHALATTRGASSCRAAGWNYDTFDEYVAITVTNVYCSHYHRPLRDSHHGFAERPEHVPDARAQDEDRMMRDLYSLMPNFCDRMANIEESYARHNPFREAAARGAIPRVTIPSGGPPRISTRQRAFH